MSRQLRIIHALAVSAMGLTFTVSAQAAASRTFVATTGNDSNTSVNCSATASCRTFGAALSVTNSGGEVVVLNSGGYGGANISQPVIITAIGVDASISVTTSGGIGLTITTSGNVTLVGLNLHGEGTGAFGIFVNQVGNLRLDNMLVENFQVGVLVASPGNLLIYSSTFNDNSVAGVFIDNPSASAYVQGTSFDHNSIGVLSAGQATVSDSSAQNNEVAFETEAGTLTLFDDRATFNDLALYAASGGALHFAKCLIANNTKAYEIDSGGSMTATNPGSSLIAPGQATIGTLSTPIALQ